MSGNVSFVGRRAIIDEVVDAVTAKPPEGIVFDLAGPRGSGRSWLLSKLRARLEEEHGCKVVEADLAQYARDAATGHEVLGEYETLLRDLADQVAGARDGFNERVRDVRAARLDDPSSVALRADDLTSILAGEFARVRTDARLVVLVDNASVPTGDLSRWFRRLLDRVVVGGSAVAVVSRGVAAGEPPDWPGRVVRREMPPLSTGEVAECLEDRLRSRPSGDVVGLVAGWSGGHALAVDAAADLVGEIRDAKELERALGAPPPSLVAKLRPALDFLHAADERTRGTVEVAATLRNFDAKSVDGVLAALALEPPDDLELVLAALPFRRPGARDGTDAFCDFFRILVKRELEGARPASANESAFIEIHGAATRYYKDELRGVVADRGKVYSRWEQLEQPETQTIRLDFLHHAASYPDRNWARFQFAAVYFDIFWWWGSYLEAPFASALLEEWGRSQRQSPDEDEFVELFRRFQRSYVPASELWQRAPEQRERWEDALDALEQIRRWLLDRHPDTAEERHVHGIVAALMGDALRQLDVDDRQADRRYGEALAAFRENADDAERARAERTPRARVEDDEWCIPWTLYFLADLALERGKSADAAGGAREALRLATDADIGDDDRDYEVIANCHRVLGDTMVERDPVKAFREYVRAVFAAYAFHVELPDAYTRLFHREQTSRAIDRLRTVAATHPDQALEICNELSSWRLTGVDAPELERMLNEHSWDELQTALFPREPSLEELDRETEYARRLRLVRRELEPELLKPVPEEEPTSIFDRVRRRRGDDNSEPGDTEPRERPFSPLLEAAVEPERFALDDTAWPRWWKDELAPEEWSTVDVEERLPEELEGDLREAIAALPPQRREVLELRDIRGWSARSVGRELGITETDQTIMLHRARSAVRRALDPKFVRSDP